MNRLTALAARLWASARPVVVKAAGQFWQVALPLLLVGGVAGVTRDVATTAATAGLSAAITVIANAVSAWRTTDPRLITIKTAASAGLGVAVAAGTGVLDVANIDAALTATIVAAASGGLAYGQTRVLDEVAVWTAAAHNARRDED